MNLSAIFIRRPVTTTLLMLGIIVFGVLAYLQLPVADLPSVDMPTIRVSAALAPAPRRWPRRWRSPREAVHDDLRPDEHQLDQHARRNRHHAAVRFEP